jgi:hypothetical protein
MSGGDAARITGLSRNAVYKSCRRVMNRLVELGAPYRRGGQLTERIKQALDDRPPAVTERILTAQIQKTMGSR